MVTVMYGIVEKEVLFTKIPPPQSLLGQCYTESECVSQWTPAVYIIQYTIIQFTCSVPHTHTHTHTRTHTHTHTHFSPISSTTSFSTFFHATFENFMEVLVMRLLNVPHENSEGLSSATNPKPKGLPSHCLLRQV